MYTQSEEVEEWAALIEPIPKLAVPLEFVKQIIFHYEENKEYIIDIDELINSKPGLKIKDDIYDILQNWIENSHVDAKKISMILDIKKVIKFIEPITSEYLESYFE